LVRVVTATDERSGFCTWTATQPCASALDRVPAGAEQRCHLATSRTAPVRARIVGGGRSRSGGGREHVVGVLDFGAVDSALVAADYDGHVTIEIENRTELPLVHAMRNADYYRDISGR
jgi:dUTPase